MTEITHRRRQNEELYDIEAKAYKQAVIAEKKFEAIQIKQSLQLLDYRLKELGEE